MAADALSQAEFQELKEWIESHKSEWPTQIRSFIERLVAVYLTLAKDKRRSAETLRLLRQAMGLIPTSEKGAQITQKC